MLRNQSVRDSLTGLINCRYPEESLAREVNRTTRKNRGLAVASVREIIEVEHHVASFRNSSARGSHRHFLLPPSTPLTTLPYSS